MVEIVNVSDDVGLLTMMRLKNATFDVGGRLEYTLTTIFQLFWRRMFRTTFVNHEVVEDGCFFWRSFVVLGCSMKTDVSVAYVGADVSAGFLMTTDAKSAVHWQLCFDWFV